MGPLRLVPLGQIARLQYGLSAKSDPSGTRPIVGMQQISDGRVLLMGASKISLSDADARGFLLHSGDVLFNRTNSADLVGKTGIVDTTDAAGAVFASYLVRISADRNVYNNQFLNLWMNLPDSVARIRKLATPGVSQYNVSPSRLAKYFFVPLLPLEKQQRVVRVLSCWDRRLDVVRNLIATKRQLRRGLRQQLLTGKRRFPGTIDSDECQLGPIGGIPADWRLVRIEEIAQEVVERGAPHGTSVLSCTKHEGLVSSLVYFGRQVFSRSLDGYKAVRRGQMVYATNHIEEGSIGLLREADIGLVSPMYTVFAPKDGVDPEFLFALLKTESYRRVFEARTNTSVNRRGSLRWRSFSKIQVGLPEPSEQRRIVDVLQRADAEIALLERLLELLRLQRRGLLQRFLSGEAAGSTK